MIDPDGEQPEKPKSKRGGARVGAGRKPSRRDDVPVKIDRQVAYRLRFVALTRRICPGEYLTGLVRDLVDRDFAAVDQGQPRPAG